MRLIQFVKRNQTAVVAIISFITGCLAVIGFRKYIKSLQRKELEIFLGAMDEMEDDEFEMVFDEDLD